MPALRELTQQQRELKALAGDSEILLESFDETFKALEGEFNQKAISLIHVVQNMNSDVDALEAEIKRLTERKKTINNKQNSMREYLRFNMEANGITKIDCPLFSITLAKGRDMVVIEDAAKIPAELVTITVTEKPDKVAILNLLKAGETVEGARMEKSKSSLRIK